jgi:hypothetical protein
MSTLRCFIAMAFGHKDTDEIYDKNIKKAVKAAGMEPIRIDRAIYLDRVDAKIRAEIAKAHVVIADLTHARPSVYWEAGFAERQSPVVYTCRSDHFISKPEDPLGNFHIHFDLRNANIIPWSAEGSNNKFTEKLRRTLLHASQSIREQKAKQEKLRSVREGFAYKSQDEQMLLVTETSLRALRSLGYKNTPNAPLCKKVGPTLVCIPVPTCLGKIEYRTLEFTINALSGFWNARGFVSRQMVSEEIPLSHNKRFKSVRRIILMPVLKAVSQNQISRAIPSWRRADSFLHYYNPRLGVPFGAYTPKTSSMEIIFIDDIKSLPEYRDTLGQILSKVETNTNPIIVADKNEW